MSLSRGSVLCLVVCCLVVNVSANRRLTQVPSFQGSGLNIINSADPSARQDAQPTPVPTLASTSGPVFAPSEGGTGLTLPPNGESPASSTPAGQPPAGALPIFAPAPSTSVAQTTPVQAPVQPPALPVVETPAPAPVTVLPVMQTPVPAPATAPPTVLPTAPVPAPMTLPQTPAPAPELVLPSLVPTPAPVPAPAPNMYPDCGMRPQCRLFVEDMLCCENAGALTSKQHAVMRLQCTHPVNYYPQCSNVTGPSNMTTFAQFETTTWSQTHLAQVAFLDDYMGNVTIDIEGPRTDANLSADCGLYVSPCMYEGELIRTVLPVQGMSFTTIPTDDFMDISNSVDEDINNLDSLVMPNALEPATCQQQNLDALDAAFFSQDWVNYTGGFQSQCNYTAFVDTVAALSPPASLVQTASLG